MNTLLRGELIKTVSTRTVAAYAVTGVALTILNVVIVTQLSGEVHNKREALAGTPTLLLLFGLVGAAGEYRHRTAAPAALVARRDRGLLLLARTGAYTVTGLAIATLMAAVAVGLGLPLLGGQPGPGLGAADVVAVAGGSLVAAAIERARTLRPDVVLMDIRMPRMDGVQATSRLTGGGIEPAPRVLVLTTFDLDEYVFGALRAGAAGFLLKDAPRERLLEAIHVVHSGEALLSPSITRRLIESFAARTDPLEPPQELLDEITPRERETLVLVARGLSNSEIAERLVVTEATVKSHVGSLLFKLGLRDRVQAVVFAYEHGIVAAGEPE